MPISCHFRNCKTLLVTSLTHVSGAIASVQTFTLTLLLPFVWRLASNDRVLTVWRCCYVEMTSHPASVDLIALSSSHSSVPVSAASSQRPHTNLQHRHTVIVNQAYELGARRCQRPTIIKQFIKQIIIKSHFDSTWPVYVQSSWVANFYAVESAFH